MLPGLKVYWPNWLMTEPAILLTFVLNWIITSLAESAIMEMSFHATNLVVYKQSSISMFCINVSPQTSLRAGPFYLLSAELSAGKTNASRNPFNLLALASPGTEVSGLSALSCSSLSGIFPLPYHSDPKIQLKGPTNNCNSSDQL